MWPFKPEITEPKEPAKPETRRVGLFSTDFDVSVPYHERVAKLNQHIKSIFSPPKVSAEASGMDAQDIKSAFQYQSSNITEAQLSWYAGQSFIGFQNCALLAQHWLIDKACAMPGRDAIRNGWEITVNGGDGIEPETLEAIKKHDKRMKINRNLAEYIKLGRVFGIRIVMFKVDLGDKTSEFYENPFNIDAITEGSYKGIAQIDPYWITPEFGGTNLSDPSSMNFYEPTWWRVNGKRIHHTHLCIYRCSEIPDVLKPAYAYGSVSVTQRIFERVYCAEKVANEAPMLVMTKRTNALHVDAEAAMSDQSRFDANLQSWIYYRDNHGVKVLDLDEKLEQFDTTLTGLDEVIMTQYQIVAAASGIPATKLLGTTPKGFNSTGEYEEASYHEELESIQANDLEPFLDRHYALLIKSEFPETQIEITVKWNPLDAMTAKESAELQKLKAETGKVLAEIGAIDGQDERARVMADPDSGYNGLADDADVLSELEEFAADSNTKKAEDLTPVLGIRG